MKRRCLPWITQAILTLSVTSFTAVTGVSQVYRVKDLGPVSGGGESGGSGVNAYHTAVGYSATAGFSNSGGTSYAAVWVPSKSAKAIAPNLSGASGINDDGVVIGQISNGPQSSAFGWDQANGLTILPLIPIPLATGYAVSANGINSKGLIAGNEFVTSDAYLPIEIPVVWKYSVVPAPTVQVLPNPVPELRLLIHAFAVNNLGIVAGQALAQAALWDTNNNNAIKILGTLPGHSTAYVSALDNHLKYAVGASEDSFYTLHAFVYEYLGWDAPGVFTDLGNLGGAGDSSASGVNDAGQVVGTSPRPGDNVPAAFIWDKRNGMRNLNTLIAPFAGWLLLYATGINQAGEITGQGVREVQTPQGPRAELHGYLLLQDNTPPTIACGKPDGHWHAHNVSLGCTASDDVAGLENPSDSFFKLSTAVPKGTETADAPTGKHQVCDAVANCAEAGPITGNKIDRKPPTVECGSADGAWHASNVFIACSAQDGGSGVAGAAGFFLSTSVPDGVETAAAPTNSGPVCDLVGNCTKVGPVTGNKIDRKPPSISIGRPQAALYYVLNQSVPASYSCVDAGSGVAGCAGNVANGANIDTSSVGTKKFLVTATDHVGNKTTHAVEYVVSYAVCLQYDPAKPFPVNAAAPIRLQLCDINGADASAASTVVTATAVGPDGTLKSVGNANPGNVFRFRAGGYVYVLDTKGFAGGLHLLLFQAQGDPTIHQAQFQLK